MKEKDEKSVFELKPNLMIKKKLVFTVKDEDMYKTVHYSPFAVVDAFRSFANASLDYALADNSVKEFIHRTDLHFDLVINEDIYYDALLMFGQMFQTPVVTICK